MNVLYDGEFLGELSNHSLAGFLMFCEQQGIHTVKNPPNNNVELFPPLKDFKISISNTEVHRRAPSKQIKEDLSNSLSTHGITIQENAEQQDLSLEISDSKDTIDNSNLLIEYSSELDIELKKLLSKELSKNTTNIKLKKVNVNSTNHHLSINISPSFDSKERIQNLSLGLTRTLLHYFNNKHISTPFSYLPIDMQKSWIKLFLEKTTNKEPTAHQVPTDTKGKQEGTIKRAEEHSVFNTSAPKKEIKVEGFFDYTIFPPQTDSKEQEYLINGSFHFKNGGTVTLENPIICIRAVPLNSVEFSGQIIPPHMVETIGIQGQTTGIGWKYVYKDWMKKVKEKGEYWITPIQPLKILPGESESLSNFQLVFHPSTENKNITVDGFIYFNNGKEQFISNNRIAFSF